ncbi:MAG: tRNA pseudouridine(55) synthase TruB [Tenericutes bacterium]|nr:tRNA pseudouridine(55) synthase TruB [Mycoplasmatota bacterium]
MNGLLVVNKPKNYTSRDVVNVLNKVFNTKAIGHIGTLDPLATGVLVCLIGKYTKLNNLLTMHNKEYIADFKLGILTDTLDATGRVLDTSNKFIKKEKLVRALKKFKKTYMQEVPMYSAVKVNGRKLYDYARHDEEVVPPKKMVTIYDIELLDYEYDDVKIRCTVSKGTYIRALIRDICEYLKTYGVMTGLVRTKINDFKIEDAYTLDEIRNGNYKLLSLGDFLDFKVIDLDEDNLNRIKNGNIYCDRENDYVLFKYLNEDIALYYRINEEELKPLIMF